MEYLFAYALTKCSTYNNCYGGVMKNTHKKLIGAGIAILLITGTAAVASYATRESLQPKSEITAQNKQQQVAAAPVAEPPRCDDGNIVGTIAGGAAGGVIGSQVGKGSGKTAATIGGVIGGAYLGNQVIPTRNVTCR
jgi:uncharacterized protein YcfJ